MVLDTQVLKLDVIWINDETKVIITLRLIAKHTDRNDIISKFLSCHRNVSIPE